VVYDFSLVLSLGVEMNLSREKLKNINVRLGIAHALNYDKVIQVQFWGDYSRLPGIC
jgi:microcin C transport system substrate-binding protein